MEVKKELVDNVLKISLSGVIDESSDFLRQVGHASGTVVVDCLNVKRVNSMGVKHWINHFSALTAKGTRVLLVDCPPCVVDQLCLVETFHSNCEIFSVMVPYECTVCHSEFVGSFKTKDVRASGVSLPDAKCGKCQGRASFSDVEGEYFSFLTYTK